MSDWKEISMIITPINKSRFSLNWHAIAKFHYHVNTHLPFLIYFYSSGGGSFGTSAAISSLDKI